MVLALDRQLQAGFDFAAANAMLTAKMHPSHLADLHGGCLAQVGPRGVHHAHIVQLVALATAGERGETSRTASGAIEAPLDTTAAAKQAG